MVDTKQNMFQFLDQMDDGAVIAFDFPTNGVVFAKLPVEIFDLLKHEVEKIEIGMVETANFNSRLAGHIKKEYDLSHCREFLEDFIINTINKHNEIYNHSSNYAVMSSARELMVSPIWVNFQKKHEFNPPHTHSGVYSFVIWVRIPYDIEEEIDLYSESRNSAASTFNFLISDIIGGRHAIPVPIGKKHEGIICIFPSALTHFVNPFYTSDGYRVSVAGNVLFNIDGK
jgi:hypothetical protein